jgi:cell fate regulator YaaT (PSP1 superfamily)
VLELAADPGRRDQYSIERTVSMPKVCGVHFRGVGKTYYFDPQDFDPQIEEYVIVETSRGQELGQVMLPVQEVPEDQIVGDLKPVLRKATHIDLLDAQRYRRQEDAAVATCIEQAERFNLSMKIVDAEYSYDGSRLTFFFTADQRVDFRQLVRELARMFKTRIELRQIGVRDEAKIIGGVGMCGRNLCCATWLTDFRPVSIRMAKQQNLPLSPMEISGVCGRLLCCLLYEDDYYREIKSRLPRVGRTIDTLYGPAKVVRVSVLKETVSVILEDGSTAELDADELAKNVPMDKQAANEALAARRRQKLEQAINTREDKSEKPASPSREEDQEASKESTPRRRTGRSRSRTTRERETESVQSSPRGGASRAAPGQEDQSPPSRRTRRRPRRKRSGSQN